MLVNWASVSKSHTKPLAIYPHYAVEHWPVRDRDSFLKSSRTRPIVQLEQLLIVGAHQLVLTACLLQVPTARYLQGREH